MSGEENDGAADPTRGSGNTNNAGVAGSSGQPGAETGQNPPASSPDGTETGIAPVLPPPEGASGSSGAPEQGGAQPEAPGSLPSTAPGQGAAGAGGSMPGSGAMPPPVVTEPEVVGGCFNQLLHNGDFERGHEGWTEITELRDIIVWRDHPDLASTGVPPQAGNYLAWIGGIPNGDFTTYPTRLEQQVAVPAEAVSLTFSGYMWAAQSDLGEPPPVVDWAILEVPDPDPESRYLWRVQYFEDTVTNGWTYFESTETDMARYAGKTVQVQTFSVPNAGGTLSVWLDSLRLEARCPR